MSKNFPFIHSGTLDVCSYSKHAHAWSMLTHTLSVHAHTRVCVHILRVFLHFFFSKNRFFFSKNNSQVKILRYWTLNQPWVLECCHHWGMRAWVVRDTHWGVYRPSHQIKYVKLLIQLGNIKTWFKIKLHRPLDHKASWRSNQRSSLYYFIVKSHIEDWTDIYTYQYKLIICYTILWPCDLSITNFVCTPSFNKKFITPPNPSIHKKLIWGIKLD